MNKMMIEQHHLEMLEVASDYVAKHEKELRTLYGSKYIAITADGRVLDSDKNGFDLMEREGARKNRDFTVISTIDEILSNRESSSEARAAI